MTDELPLWASVKPEDPAFLVVPSTELERRFKAFHKDNAHVYARLETRALELARSGRTRIGVAELVEDLRYDPTLRSKGEAFKINNSYRAFYARLLVHRQPSLEEVIQLRKQTHADPPAWANDPDYLSGRRVDE